MDQKFYLDIERDNEIGEHMRNIPDNGYVVGIDPGYINFAWCKLEWNTDRSKKPAQRRYVFSCFKEPFMGRKTSTYDTVFRAVCTWSEKHKDELSDAFAIFYEHQYQGATQRKWSWYEKIMDSWFRAMINRYTYKTFANVTKKALSMSTGKHTTNKQLEERILEHLLFHQDCNTELTTNHASLHPIRIGIQGHFQPTLYELREHTRLRKFDDYMSAMICALYPMGHYYRMEAMRNLMEDIKTQADRYQIEQENFARALQEQEEQRREKAMAQQVYLQASKKRVSTHKPSPSSPKKTTVIKVKPPPIINIVPVDSSSSDDGGDTEVEEEDEPVQEFEAEVEVLDDDDDEDSEPEVALKNKRMKRTDDVQIGHVTIDQMRIPHLVHEKQMSY
jgi:hypothetical protein